MGRFTILNEIERLDPERDHQRIMHLSFGYEFSWDSVRALEIALYRTYYFWREVGVRIGIRDIPPSSQAFERWAGEYERAQFRFTEANQRIGSATRDLFTSWFPRLFAPIVHFSIYALLDDAMLSAFGFPQPLPGTRPMIRGTLRLRGRLLRWFPPRREPHFFTDNPNRTHPGGYEVSRLGPPRLVEAEARGAAKVPADGQEP